MKQAKRLIPHPLASVFPRMVPTAYAKTCAVWIKDRQTCGHWFRGKHEPLSVATKGDMPPPSELHESIFEGPPSQRDHSSKPDVVREWIAWAYPSAGRIELFARRPATPDWAVWGHEADAA
jgi:N6-adenosine-specific RNA methylase IME4